MYLSVWQLTKMIVGRYVFFRNQPVERLIVHINVVRPWPLRCSEIL
jgi:hypothetical protein